MSRDPDSSESTPSPARRPSATRIVLIALIAFVVAITARTFLGAVGVSSDHAFRLLVTPLIGGAIVFLGLPGYPARGRIRLALMVAILLLLFSGAS